MAKSEEGLQLSGPAAAGPSIAVSIGATAGLTLAAIAAGAFLGLHLSSVIKASLKSGAPSEIAGAAKIYSGDADLRELPPIIANLADSSDAWVRLQASIVFDAKATPKPDIMAAQIAEDILGLLRTLSIAQIGGASGLQHLRDDLNERAAIRSEGRVRELLIQALVVQ